MKTIQFNFRFSEYDDFESSVICQTMYKSKEMDQIILWIEEDLVNFMGLDSDNWSISIY